MRITEKVLSVNFYPNASHQTIILSTDSEINFEHYKELAPYITKAYCYLHMILKRGKQYYTIEYFFNNKGEKQIEV